MLHIIEQSDPDFAAVFSRWYTGSTEHRMHFESSNVKINANSGQGCSLSTCRFSAAIDPVLRFVLAGLCRLLEDGAKLFACFDDWYLHLKPHCPRDVLALISPATRSVKLDLHNPSKSNCGGHPARTLSPNNCSIRSNPHSVASVDSFTFRVTASPVLLSMETSHHGEKHVPIP